MGGKVTKKKKEKGKKLETEFHAQGGW